MTAKTLKEAIEAKLKLEEDILDLIREFEDKFELLVDKVELSSDFLFGGGGRRTDYVRVSVEI